MGRFKSFKTVTTWLCVAILLLIGCFDSFSSVVCIHSDGAVDVESSDGFGHCVPAGESQLSKDSSSPCLTESCLDLPLGDITGVPAPAKRLAPMAHNWSIPYCDGWARTHLIAALSGNIENALVKLKYISQRQLASLVHNKSVLLLI